MAQHTRNARVRASRNSSRVYLDLPHADLRALPDQPNVNAVRPVRLHSVQVAEASNVHGLVGRNNLRRTSLTGKGVKVAILDSGIDVHHPDLKQQIDLANSRNFTSSDPNDIADEHGHGTHVAGIVGGKNGLAPEAEILVCRVFDKDGIGEEGAVVEAVEWAVDHGAEIINYSGGYAPIYNNVPIFKPPWVWPQAEMEEEEAFRTAFERGVLGIVSAGNYGQFGNGTITAPATSSDVIAIASMSKNSVPSSFSSIGPVRRSPSIDLIDMVGGLGDLGSASVRTFQKPDLMAVGGEVSPFLAQLGGCYYEHGVVSARSRAIAEPNQQCLVGDHHQKMSGTSQSAPMVTGLACLILEELRDQGLAGDSSRRPRLLRGILRRCCERRPNVTRYQQGHGVPLWDDIQKLLARLRTGSIAPGVLSR